MATWNVSFEISPTGGASPATGDDDIRALKSAVRERVDVEHWMTTGSGSLSDGHGVHRVGAARPYYTTVYPTKLPDGATALANNFKSLGRIAIKPSSDPVMAVYNGTTWLGISKELTRCSIQGYLAVASNCIPPICFTRTVTISRVMARLGTKPSSTNTVLLQLKKRSPTTSAIVFTAIMRPVLSAGAAGNYCLRTSGQLTVAGAAALSPTSFLVLDIVQVGGTTKGSDLAFIIEASLK